MLFYVPTHIIIAISYDWRTHHRLNVCLCSYCDRTNFTAVDVND